jgi:phage/plasmid-associated DNA primase
MEVIEVIEEVIEEVNKSNYGRVLISSIYERSIRIEIKTIEEYIKIAKRHNTNDKGGICEIIGLEEFKVKPFFDIDFFDEKDNYDIKTLINNIIIDIKKIFNSDVYKARRQAREEEKRIDNEYKKLFKYSYRLYLKAQITYYNIPILFAPLFEKYPNEIDTTVYDRNRVLMSPMNTKKKRKDVPELEVEDCGVFDCCASYILTTYEDLDKITIKPLKTDNKIKLVSEIIDEEDTEDAADKFARLSNLIKLLSSNRSDNYGTWTEICWCLMNICKRENIPKHKCVILIHEFSQLSKFYDVDNVEKWLDENYKRAREIGYCWNYLIHTCIKNDNPEYYTTLNHTKKYNYIKKEFEKENCKILHPPIIVHLDKKNNYILQPISLFEKSYRHFKCSILETNKKGETKYNDRHFVNLWLNDPKILNYDNISFNPPPIATPAYEFNTWTNYEILKYDLEEDNNNIIDRFLDYMKNLFANEEVVNFLLAYFANRIRNPAIRNKVCIIIYGEEGDGKNRITDIIKNIMGLSKFSEIETAKQLFESHSMVEFEKIFVCLNEAKGKENYENSDRLKSRITTDTILLNPKGIAPFQINNYCDYIMTTNNNNAVNLDDKSRRYLYIETTSHYRRNVEFFNNFNNDIVENKKALRIIYNYLYNYDIKKIIPSGNFQNHIPETKIQKTIINNNRDKILIFLEFFVEDFIKDPIHRHETTIKIINADLFIYWKQWVEKYNFEIKYNIISFGTRLGLIINKKINANEEIIKRDTNRNIIIDIEKITNYFIKLNE